MNSLENEAQSRFSYYTLGYGLTESVWLACPSATFRIYFALKIVLYFISSTGFSFSQCLFLKDITKCHSKYFVNYDPDHLAELPVIRNLTNCILFFTLFYKLIHTKVVNRIFTFRYFVQSSEIRIKGWGIRGVLCSLILICCT